MKVDKVYMLKKLKEKYQKEGLNIIGFFGSFSRETETNKSDFDILYELSPKFIKSYKGFQAFSRLSEIKKELSKKLKIKVDLAAKSGLSKTARKYIFRDLKYV